MKKQIQVSLMLLFASSALFVQCNKQSEGPTAEAIASTEKVAFVSTAETAILEEIQTAGYENIQECIETCLNALPNEPLSATEMELLSFVREEELLAHDVYQFLYALYPIPVFNHISNSEMLHTFATKVLLDKYELPDPAADHESGIFSNPEIQALYDELTAFGAESIGNALTAGAIIEDYDINDLIELLTEIDNQDIGFAFNQLYRGSRNHLRAFNAHLVFRNLAYVPQYISQELFDDITSTPWEIGMGFCQCTCNQTVIDSNKIKD